MEKKEYIDREAVLTVLKAVFDETDPVGEEQFGILKAHRIVREAPAADVVEVVRCKDCVWWEACGRLGTVGKCESPHNGLWNEYTYAGDYCSYGERKEE